MTHFARFVQVLCLAALANISAWVQRRSSRIGATPTNLGATI